MFDNVLLNTQSYLELFVFVRFNTQTVSLRPGDKWPVEDILSTAAVSKHFYSFAP